MTVERETAQDEARVAVVSGQGRVARRGPLTILSAEAPNPATLMAVVDRLAETDQWSFGAVASALHTYVVENNVSGVAAVLDTRPADPQGEPIVFLFDQAVALVGDNELRGQGRSGWTTEIITSSPVEIRLGALASRESTPGTDLRVGVVEAAGATVPVLLVAAKTTTPPPPAVALPEPPRAPTTVPPPPIVAPPPTAAPPPAFSPPPPIVAPPPT